MSFFYIVDLNPNKLFILFNESGRLVLYKDEQKQNIILVATPWCNPNRCRCYRNILTGCFVLHHELCFYLSRNTSLRLNKEIMLNKEINPRSKRWSWKCESIDPLKLKSRRLSFSPSWNYFRLRIVWDHMRWLVDGKCVSTVM